ncbi:MAG: carboxylate--amine ligase/circularly permuted type 2 ATP-grasp protein, partial [Actinomycetota bacterium]|nr:carboxylate--amine ligase/circularly permuted type 2 ATP-grasp protein [Actinomycetota bacterium]
HLEAAGDWAVACELAEALLARGGSSARQRARFAERGKLTDVVALAMAETRGQYAPPVATLALTAGYTGTGEDEALAGAGVPHLSYRPVFAILDELGVTELNRRAAAAANAAIADGFTFGAEGRQQPFPIDLVPRIVAPHEWAALATGLTQRARALEMFLEDIYGPARIVDAGILDWSTVHDGPEWLAAARDLPGDVVRAPVIGFDLVRDSLGGWRVLEDNTRVPSGVGYAIGIRHLLQRAMPELGVGAALRDPGTALSLIGDTLRAISGREEPVVALLSDGADNSAWYEHRMIAAGAGLLLVQPDEVVVEGGRVHAGGRRVDVLYLRLSADLLHLRDSGGKPIGERIWAAACEGAVRLANAPGSGVADDKAMYCLVPDFISYYLGERPLLAPVATYRCANSAERESVLQRLGELVTKPVDGYGGGGVLIGPDASPVEVETRRGEIEANPRGWIAQEVVALSTHPVLDGGRLQPRHVDLRAFVYVSGTGSSDARLADLALTRVAPAGSMVVNSSRGGGVKDTWLVIDPNDDGR